MGDCDHKIGTIENGLSSLREVDVVTSGMATIEPDNKFNFCPDCGAPLAGEWVEELPEGQWGWHWWRGREGSSGDLYFIDEDGLAWRGHECVEYELMHGESGQWYSLPVRGPGE